VRIVLLLSSAVLLPWWCTFLIALWALTRSPAEEVILAGVIIDILYATPLPFAGGFEFAATAAALGAYLAAFPLRTFAHKTFTTE
jgi:hypothetical protein